MKKAFSVFLLSGFGVYFFDKIVHIIPWGALNSIPVSEWLHKDINLYTILIAALLLSGLYFLLRCFFAKTSKSYNKDPSAVEKQIQVLKYAQLKEFNQLCADGLLWKWNVYFGINGRPYIDNLTPYCLAHNGGHPPLKMQYDNLLRYYSCVIQDCSNKVSADWRYGDAYNSMKLLIESQLRKRGRLWEEANKIFLTLRFHRFI